jgi:hypothetical protein
MAGAHQAKRRANMLKVADAMKRVAATSLGRLARAMEQDPGLRLTTNETRQMFKDATEIERSALGIPESEAMSNGELDTKIGALIAELDRAREGGDPGADDEGGEG